MKPSPLPPRWGIPCRRAGRTIKSPAPRAMGPYKPSSMIDFVEGRPVEVEAIWGEPVRQAQAAGASMPRMAALYAAILKAIDQRNVS